VSTLKPPTEKTRRKGGNGNRKVAGSIPGLLPLLLAKCGGVPEQDTT